MKYMDPHKTVDERSHYIILVKLKTLSEQYKRNYIVAMYSEKPLKKDSPLNIGPGFVCSVTNQKTFYLGKKAASPRLT